MQPTEITAADLLVLIESFGVPAVITKNKHPNSENNYRPRPRHRGQMLDGFWLGQPSRVTPGAGFSLHFVERNKMLWIGDYLGVIDEGGGTFSIIVGESQCFDVIDLNFKDPQQAKLKNTLKKNGAVIYSYLDSPATDAATNDDTLGSARTGPAFKMSQVKQRLQQQVFRNDVFARHGKQCIVTKCKVEALLEAAHLDGRVWEEGDNTGDDGIPLRVDIHRAYDRGLITLDDEHRVSYIAPELMEQYGQFWQQ
ncbi:MAG: HNH endonuclease [Comamonadaceae bacterium]|nr:MAG: HNH endonuclease [Comamonadaceae bacterium]